LATAFVFISWRSNWPSCNAKWVAALVILFLCVVAKRDFFLARASNSRPLFLLI
jgi:hypothetical protein